MLTNNLKPSAVSVTPCLLKFLEKKKSKPTQKREKLQKAVASLSKEFLEYAFEATDEDDAVKMKDMLVNKFGMQREAEKIENEMKLSKLDQTIALLSSQKKCI